MDNLPAFAGPSFEGVPEYGHVGRSPQDKPTWDPFWVPSDPTLGHPGTHKSQGTSRATWDP